MSTNLYREPTYRSVGPGALISIQPTCMWVAPRTAMLINNAFECSYFDLDGDGRSLSAA